MNETLEIEKILLERHKIDIENRKARWTLLSILIPLLGAIVTAFFALWSNYQAEKSKFKLRAAELVMQTSSPRTALGRAKFLEAIFSDELSNFVTNVDAKNYIHEADPHPQTRIELLKIFADKANDATEILSIWR